MAALVIALVTAGSLAAAVTLARIVAALYATRTGCRCSHCAESDRYFAPMHAPAVALADRPVYRGLRGTAVAR